MLTEERQRRILQQLGEDGKVLSAELAKQFSVSEDTVRRDLRDLAKAGFCQRVYGGALLHMPQTAPVAGPIAERSHAMRDSKIRLARQAARLIGPDRTLLIDASSTNVEIARALPRQHKTRVITNAPAVAIALEDHPNCTTVVLGGIFSADKGACLGPQTIREAAHVHADIFILGACGVDQVHGLTAWDPGEAEVKRYFASRSTEILVAATADKLGTVAPFQIVDISALNHLVAEHVDDGTRAAYERLDIGVHDVHALS